MYIYEYVAVHRNILLGRKKKKHFGPFWLFRSEMIIKENINFLFYIVTDQMLYLLTILFYNLMYYKFLFLVAIIFICYKYKYL